jgi:hypothetical protein
MDEYTAMEEAYKKGYEAGKRDAIHTHCEQCLCSDKISCPAGRVWCSRMMRYMKLDAFCSEGSKRKE